MPTAEFLLFIYMAYSPATICILMRCKRLSLPHTNTHTHTAQNSQLMSVTQSGRKVLTANASGELKVAESGAKFIWHWLNLGTFWPALRGVHKPKCISLPAFHWQPRKFASYLRCEWKVAKVLAA